MKPLAYRRGDVMTYMLCVLYVAVLITVDHLVPF